MFSVKGLSIAALVTAGCFTALFSLSYQFRNLVHALSYERTLDRYGQTDATTTDVVTRIGPDGRKAALVSAFYGLDDAVPFLAEWIVCKGAYGGDGMPVLFSHEVDVATLEPGDFKVTTASGARGRVECLTLAPADDRGELRTVLLMGPMGSADDQPASVEIVGNVLSLDNAVNFKGATAAVTGLERGPSLVLAEIVPQGEWALGSSGKRIRFGGGAKCPAGTRQVVRVVWDGGVTKPGGEEVDDAERRLYTVVVTRADRTIEEITPFALGDLYDGDNNHELCLDTTDVVRSVSFPAGHLTDPREDLNPATSVALEGR